MNLVEIKKQFNLNDIQLSNVELIVNECNKYGISIQQIAYVLATAYHECKLIPCDEIGKGKGKPYGKKIKYNRTTYSMPDKLYFGRGFVQLTWYELYERFGKLLGVDLLNSPELALQPLIATEILVLGMYRGLFTGAKLDRYINANKTDYLSARKIINGTDKSELIKGYALKFLELLK